MDRHDYLSQLSKSELEILAAATGTKPIYLRQVSTGFRRPSIALALKLERATGARLTARALRPDLPWPETRATATATEDATT